MKLKKFGEIKVGTLFMCGGWLWKKTNFGQAFAPGWGGNKNSKPVSFHSWMLVDAFDINPTRGKNE